MIMFNGLQTEKILLLISAMRDKRTPWYAKTIVVFVLAYIISPVDIIPDFIPVLGLLDEIILIPIAYKLVMKFVPDEVIAEVMSRPQELTVNTGLKITGAFIIILIGSALIYSAYYLLQQF